MKDYPEDQHLLSRKAAKAKKEAAAKQAAAKPKVLKPEEVENFKEIFLKNHFKRTRTTNVVRNAGCARSRYTRKFFFNQLMN